MSILTDTGSPYFQTNFGHHERRKSELHSFQFSQIERVTLASEHQPHGVGVRVHGLRSDGVHHPHGHRPRQVRPHRDNLPIGADERHRVRQLQLARQPLLRAELWGGVQPGAATVRAGAPHAANRDSPALRPIELARPKPAAPALQQPALAGPAPGPAEDFRRRRRPENRLDLIKSFATSESTSKNEFGHKRVF